MDSRLKAKIVSDDADDKQLFTFERGGLSLRGRLYGRLESEPPLVCLPGLTRNSRDFDGLATALRDLRPEWPIVAFDSRGRGLSERCDDPNLYSVPEETLDLLAGLDALGIEQAAFLGTSRGVLLILTLAAFAPQRILAAIFNDAGPRLETAGLKAIRALVGQGETFETMEDAAVHVAELYGPTFPSLAESDFRKMAEALYDKREDGLLAAAYDPRLAEPFNALDLDQPLPELWDLFETLVDRPLLVLRGEMSNILSAETAQEMAKRHRDLEHHIVEGQGHAPWLDTAGLPQIIASFLARSLGPARP
ncbi:Pimeloyl-ACP methyl ester carboxylesterase [Fulvimarina manganoxydans]|uniref:Pimeloyl-ACP methyl ester carboxylesterase n=1 Tax=Fulvimarina manganoxydans TaxID=937218 RepID=A0A1W2DD44_9HYPH|nr:alpha/beta hydrolase [Fulvimarina manganoxydans]SMC95469.1 Pimeloyl-ACP methyl ester carboxylesterase [Fulvimarina manganoxydans]